jgi:hypothetical protein
LFRHQQIIEKVGSYKDHWSFIKWIVSFFNLIKTSNLEEINLYEIVGVDAVMKEMSNFWTSNQAKVLKISQWQSIII